MARTQRKSWLGRLRLPLLLLAALVALLALLPQLLLPTVERAASASLRTPIDIGWIDVDLLSGSVGLRRVAAGEDAALTVDRITARPDLRQLLGGTIVLERIEIDGVHGTVDQNEQGLPALRGLPFPEVGGEGSTGPPAVVQEILLTEVDIAAQPPPELRRHPIAVHLDELLLRQIPTANAGSAYQGDLRGSLDGIPLTARARAEQTAAGTRIEAEADLTGSPVSSEQLVLPRGFESLTATADGKLTYLLDPERKRDRLTVDLELADLKLSGAEKTALSARSVRVTGLTIDLSAGEADLGRVTITAPRIEAALMERGLVYPGLLPALVESGVEPPATKRSPPAWRIVGGRIEASDGVVALRRDQHRTQLDLSSFSWRDIASGKSGELRIAARASAGGAIEVTGRLGIDPATVDLTADVTALVLPDLTALLNLRMKLARGTASGSVQLSGDPAAPRIVAVLDVSQLHTEPPVGEDKDRILAVDRLETRFTVEPGPAGSIEVGSLLLSYPYAMIQREATGIFPLDALAEPAQSAAAPDQPPQSAAAPDADTQPPAPAPAAARPVRIAALTISNGRVDFVDQTTQPPFWMGLAATEAMVREVTLTPLELSQLDLSARQDELHPVRASARRTGDQRWQASATLDGLSLATLNPYLSPVLGYEARTGTLSLEIDATLDKQKLVATNAVALDGVGVQQTGLDVIQRQTGIPLSVALSLLKDVGGEVALSIPVQIDTVSGKYELGDFVSQAIGRAVLGALSSPLRWLGMLFGTDGPPHALAIDPIPFPAGSASLDDAGTTRVAQVARILASHAELDVILKAQVAPQDEAAAGGTPLVELAERRVDAVRSAFASARYGSPILPSRLIVAPWSPPADGKLDPAAAVYVEVQSR